MSRRLSVLVCTHNAPVERLRRVLHAIAIASKAIDLEVIVVDNASSPPVPESVVEGLADARILREERLGLVHARIAGIASARSELLVFVDDDNVVDPDYFDVARRVAEDRTDLGAWSGQLVPDYEKPPDDSLAPYLEYIGIRTFDSPREAFSFGLVSIPTGAGLCVRTTVARTWARSVTTDARRQRLGVSGSGLMRCEDLDLAFTSYDVALGTAVLPDLRLTHVIPAARVQPSYVAKVLWHSAYSLELLKLVRGARLPRWWGRPAQRGLLAVVRTRGATDRRMALSLWRGQWRAWRDFGGPQS